MFTYGLLTTRATSPCATDRFTSISTRTSVVAAGVYGGGEAGAVGGGEGGREDVGGGGGKAGRRLLSVWPDNRK